MICFSIPCDVMYLLLCVSVFGQVTNARAWPRLMRAESAIFSNQCLFGNGVIHYALLCFGRAQLLFEK